MDDHNKVKKENTDLIQHEISQKCIKKTRGKYKKIKYKYESRFDKLSQFMTFHCQICSKKYSMFSTYKGHMANWHGVAPKTLNEQFLESTKKRRKYKPRIKKSNTVISEVENQMPLELKNDDNKISENSTNYMKHEKSHQIPINTYSCVSHKFMTLDDNMALDTSGDAGTIADTSNKKNKFLNVLNDNCTISITTNDNINSMNIVDNDTSTLVSADNNATSGINNYIVNKKKIKSEYESRYDKLSQSMTFYCQVCSKKYATFNTFKVHMANFHGVAPKTLNKYYFGTQERKKYERCFKTSNTVITEVENHMSLELKNDDNKISENSTKNKFYFGTKERRKYKPRIKKSNTVITEVKNQTPLELKNDDNKISENSTNYIKHEKSHQIPINSNSCVSHKSMTDDNLVLDTSDEAGTNADTFNNKNKSLNVLNDNCTISITANDNINSMDIVDNDTSTLVSADNNGTLGINNYIVVCKTCKQDFASVSDFEKHQYIIYENLIICQNQKNLMVCEPKEHYINANYNELFNSEIIPPNIPPKDTWTPDENHLKALNEICEVQQPFYCDFCKEICEQYDHYQFNQWCSFNENLKCHVCNQEFSDKKLLELHEREHVNLHFC